MPLTAFSVSVPALQWKSYSNNTYVFRRSNTGRCSTKHRDRGCMPHPGEPVPARVSLSEGRPHLCPEGGSAPTGEALPLIHTWSRLTQGATKP